jgi:hypothetical protein
MTARFMLKLKKKLKNIEIKITKDHQETRKKNFDKSTKTWRKPRKAILKKDCFFSLDKIEIYNKETYNFIAYVNQ